MGDKQKSEMRQTVYSFTENFTFYLRLQIYNMINLDALDGFCGGFHYSTF